MEFRGRAYLADNDRDKGQLKQKVPQVYAPAYGKSGHTEKYVDDHYSHRGVHVDNADQKLRVPIRVWPWI